MPNREASTIVNTFQSIHNMLDKKSQKQQFWDLDNEASNFIKEFLLHQSINNLVFPPNEHGVNAAKRTIQTFKNHFTSGLCWTDPNFPMQLWDQLLRQAQDLLKILCIVQDDPSESAWETSLINHGNHLRAKKLYTHIHNPAHHGAQKELMGGTPNQ